MGRNDTVNDAAQLFQEFMKLAQQHENATKFFGAFNRTFQFDLVDAEPFYMEVKDGKVVVKEGDSGLDWKYRDWERATCVHTSARALKDIIAGRVIASELFFDQEMGFAPRRRADRHTEGKAIVAWFYTLIRLGLERGRNAGYEELLARMAKGDGGGR